VFQTSLGTDTKAPLSSNNDDISTEIYIIHHQLFTTTFFDMKQILEFFVPSG